MVLISLLLLELKLELRQLDELLSQVIQGVMEAMLQLNTMPLTNTTLTHEKRFKGGDINQGDRIGRVGMTGYTSGPHVCYRFWKTVNKLIL